jgi:7-cyano-7-deazaguanine synthase
MSPHPPDQATAILTSGGLDSCIMLSEFLKQGHRVQPLYVRSGLVWEQAELKALHGYLERTRHSRLQQLVTLDSPLGDLYGGHWSITGLDTPAAGEPDEMVFLPGRNAVIVVKAAVWCQMNGIQSLALAPLRTSPFPDAKEPFFAALQTMLDCYHGIRLRLVLPFLNMDKREVMHLGRDQPLECTFSCLSPIDGMHCGSCNKCAERQQAFRLLEWPDPTRYGH